MDSAARTRARRLAASLAVLALGACAACATVTPIDRFMLSSERETVRLSDGKGAISHAQSRKVLEELKARAPQTNILDQHVAVEEALAGTKLSVGNVATPLEDGKAAYRSMLQAIRAARHHIHMEMYIFEDDEVGREFARALAERARAGVTVRLIYDPVGSLNTQKEFFEDMEKTGISVVAFNPPAPGLLKRGPVGAQARTHRKLLISDGRVAFLGGINISRVYGANSASRPGGGSSASGGGSSGGVSGSGAGGGGESFEDRPWRDLQVRLEGPVVADLQKAFVAQWKQWKKEEIPEAGLYPKLAATGTAIVRAIASSPSDEGSPDKLYLALISAIESAETEVCITNAYFVPHPQLMEALSAAARRGVDVKLMLPGKTDSAMVFHAGRAHYQPLLDAGVKIFERQERLLHAKSAVIDGVWSTVGSTNLDWRSLAYNDELNAIVLGPEFAAKMKAIFEKDVANSKAITPEKWARRPFMDRVKETAAVNFSELL
jgi:cardiolipin synthase